MASWSQVVLRPPPHPFLKVVRPKQKAKKKNTSSAHVAPRDAAARASRNPMLHDDEGFEQLVDDIADVIAVDGPDSDDRDCIDDPIIPVRRRFRVLTVSF